MPRDDCPRAGRKATADQLDDIFGGCERLMKKIIALLALCASLAILAVSAAAQTAPAAQGACTDENKTALYTEFTTNRTTAPTKAYEAAKKYLTACPAEEGDIPAYLKKWSAAYEKEARKLKLTPLLYNEKKFAEAFAIGKEILAEDPNNLKVMIDLGYLGYLATITAKNEQFNNESLQFARKAIQQIEAGTKPDSWSAFKSKEEALAYLYNAIGRLTLKSNTPETLNALIKAAQFETDVKKDPWMYFFIAAAYESGPYGTLSADYKAKCEGKDLTPECKLALENINQVVDRMIDAYARAVAFAGNDAKFAANKKEWMDNLATWYKYRNNDSDAGLTEMIASVMSKPLPPVPTPMTTLPASSTAPTSGVGNGATAPATTTTTGAATTGASTAAPKPTNTSTPTNATTAKPKPQQRNNHRRRN